MKKTAIILLVLFLTITNGFTQNFDYSPEFKAGKPVEMEEFSFLKGEWKIDLFYTAEKSSKNPNWLPWGAVSESTFKQSFNGTFIFETSKGFPINPSHEGFKDWEYLAIFSYDRFNKVYRVIYSDNILGLSDIYEGNFIGDSTFVITNINTSTYNNHGTNNTAQKNRVDIQVIDENKFTLIWSTVDENKIKNLSFDNIPWQWSVKMVYSKNDN